MATAPPAAETQPEEPVDVNADDFDEVASELTASDIALQVALAAWGDVSPDSLPQEVTTLQPPWMEAATARDANTSDETLDDLSERPSSDGLPIHEHREEIKVAMQSQRVTVLVGGTGCGKSTQMPQYILEDAAAQGKVANVMVTQPRRMAAVTLARRVARERGEKVGTEVGWRIRGDTNPGRQLSFATAGYLLSWFTVDPSVFGDLTHIVLDEAHERTAEMELLILLVRLLMRFYPGPQLVLMSATIDTGLFVEYFQEFAQPAGSPLRPLTVDGRLFPVETLHLEDLSEGRAPRGAQLPDGVRQMAARCVPKVFQGSRVARDNIKPRVWRELEELAVALIPAVAEAGSTMIVFIPGYADLARIHSKLYWSLPLAKSDKSTDLEERAPPKPEDLGGDGELQDIAEKGPDPGSQVPHEGVDAVGADLDEPESGNGGAPTAFRLFALHSQVPNEDQDLVLDEPGPGVCNVVLATNIAESSVTLPEVCGVVDFGVFKTTFSDPSQPGLTQLCARWCSKASLRQRQGRAGRTRPGWCVRLVTRVFSEDGVPGYDQPEILRAPLTKLWLQAKGISDGLTRALQDDQEASRQLERTDMAPRALLQQLIARPSVDAIDAAVHQLAELGVLTEDNEFAEVTVVGRLSLWLPLDVRLCRLLWLGALWGCAPEAAVLAAACSTGNPFDGPTRFAFDDDRDFTKQLRRTAESRRHFDGGHFSEPIMLFRLFGSWARRLKMTPEGLPHQAKWARAARSLAESEAVDAQKMLVFAGYVADIAMRGRDLCDDGRGEEECPVRQSLHRLVCLLRRPDLSFVEQKERPPEKAPRIREVFQASAGKVYALLAACFSDRLLTGRHKYSDEELGPMLDALESLPDHSGVASEDAIVIPRGLRTMHKGMLTREDGVRQIVQSLCGAEPSSVAVMPRFVACGFGKDAAASRTPTQAGLPAAEGRRLADLGVNPRLCFMASGGFRRFPVGDVEMLQAVSPYEIQFSLVQSSTAAKTLAILGEQNPLGFACHVPSPEAPLGADHFACVASNCLVGESSSVVRVDGATLLCAEQLLYALLTLDPHKVPLTLGFTLGACCDKHGGRPLLAGVKLHSAQHTVLFTRKLPGLLTIERLNGIRKSLKHNLQARVSKNSQGQDILLWEDRQAADSLRELVDWIEDASLLDVPIASSSLVWSSHKPGSLGNAAAVGSPGREDASSEKDIASLVPIEIPIEQTEATVVMQERGDRRVRRNKDGFECPECGEAFGDWGECLEHLQATCHLDVFSPEAVDEAKASCSPVLFRCYVSGKGFASWASCEEHLLQNGYLSWAGKDIQRLLCLPDVGPGDRADDGIDETDAEQAGKLDVPATASRAVDPAPAGDEPAPAPAPMAARTATDAVPSASVEGAPAKSAARPRSAAAIGVAAALGRAAAVAGAGESQEGEGAPSNGHAEPRSGKSAPAVPARPRPLPQGARRLPPPPPLQP